MTDGQRIIDGLNEAVEHAERPWSERPWPLMGYAPGDYQNRCSICGNIFTGDKRAVQCLPCAASKANAALKDAVNEAAGLREALELALEYWSGHFTGGSEKLLAQDRGMEGNDFRRARQALGGGNG